MTYKAMATQHGVFIHTDADEVKIGYMVDPRVEGEFGEKLQAAGDAICDEINKMPEQWRLQSIEATIAEVAKRL